MANIMTTLQSVTQKIDCKWRLQYSVTVTEGLRLLQKVNFVRVSTARYQCQGKPKELSLPAADSETKLDKGSGGAEAEKLCLDHCPVRCGIR